MWKWMMWSLAVALALGGNVMAEDGKAAAGDEKAAGESAKAEVKLRWAPPELENPETREIGVDGKVFQLKPDRDYMIKLPTDKVRTEQVWLEGGRNIVLIGGVIALPDGGPNLSNNDGTRRGIYIKNATGTVHIEGVLFDGEKSGEYDAVAINAPKAIVQLQNIHVAALGGSFKFFHGDIVQPWGGVKELRIDRLTGTTSYQGLQINQDAGKIGKEFIRNVNLKGSGQWKLWLTGKEMADQGGYPPTHLDEVYIEPTNKWGEGKTSLAQSAFPGVGAPKGAVFKEGEKAIHWPELDHVHGEVKLGPPPGGDFVPAESVGLKYKSPGYEAPKP